jgi:tetratricopeptide (TPR) repeat protein
MAGASDIRSLTSSREDWDWITPRHGTVQVCEADWVRADDKDRNNNASHGLSNDSAIGVGGFSPAWDQRCVELWLQINDLDEVEFGDRHRALLGELQEHSPVVAFEQAALHDSFGRPDLAIPLYEAAIAESVPGERRRRAVIQMASSHRNMGNPERAVELLSNELTLPEDHLTGAANAFLALALNDVGQPREALAIAIGALAPYLPRYNRSVARFAGEILGETLDNK